MHVYTMQKQEALLEKKRVLQSQLESVVAAKGHAEGDRFARVQSVDWENGCFEWSEKLGSVLKSRFKLDSFRPLQLSTINATLSGEDIILIMPTGTLVLHFTIKLKETPCSCMLSRLCA